MLARPDANSFELLPWGIDDAPSARMFCDIANLDGSPFDGDPRQVLKRNLSKARDKGFTFYVAPDMEFFYFADSRSDDPARAARHRVVLRPHHGRRRRRHPQEDDPHARGDGHPGGVLPPRRRTEPARDRPALHRRAHHGRQRHDLPPGREGGRARARRVRHVHAQAAPRRAGLGHAHALLALRGRRQRVPRRRRRARPLEDRQGLHRRVAPPRTGDHRGHEPVGELVQAARRRLRSAGPHLLGPQQPLRARAAATAEEGQERLDPHRVPRPRPGLQSLPRVLADARRRPQGHRRGLRPPARGHQQHLRDDAGGARRGGDRLVAAEPRRGDQRHGRLRARRRGTGRARLRVVHPQQAGRVARVQDSCDAVRGSGPDTSRTL